MRMNSKFFALTIAADLAAELMSLHGESSIHVDRPRRAERCKRGFSCYKQNEKGSGSSPQLRAKGSRGRMTEKGDKSD